MKAWKVTTMRAEEKKILEKYQRVSPVDVEGLARELGLSIHREPLGRGVSGKLVRLVDGPRGDYAIYVDEDDNRRRQRFTIAHEIAHFLLHRDRFEREIVDNERYRSRLSNAEETRANGLAADILVPVPTIRYLQSIGYETAAELARQLDVSELAMSIRLSYLRDQPVHNLTTTTAT